MDKQRNEQTELPPSLGAVARRALAHHGLLTFEDVAGRSESELLAIHGVGPKAVRILREELAARGRRWVEDQG